MSRPTVDDLIQTAGKRIRVLIGSDDPDDVEERAYLVAVHGQLIIGQERRRIVDRLTELCPCDTNPETTGGPEQACPVHGDGVTFVADVRRLVAVQQCARALVDGASSAISSDVMLVDSVAFERLSDALEAES